MRRRWEFRSSKWPTRTNPSAAHLKYVVLFIGLVFLSYFVFEATTGKRVHPAQYILVGIAQIIFYLLLLSFAESIGFELWLSACGRRNGYSAFGQCGMDILQSGATGPERAFVIFTLLYSLIYLLLTLEDNALLVGAIASFLAVAGAMYFTRSIDWYSSLPSRAQQTGPMAPGHPSEAEMSKDIRCRRTGRKDYT